MSHNTLIGGTAYSVKSGKTLVGGTVYDIKSGKTLVGGTSYDIKFAEDYYYGDGSLNTVVKGYQGKIAVNGETNLFQNVGSYETGNYGSELNASTYTGSVTDTQFNRIFEREFRCAVSGDYSRTDSALPNSPILGYAVPLTTPQLTGTTVSATGVYTNWASGTNTVTFKTVLPKNSTFYGVWYWAYLGGSITISAIKFNVGGTYYTLEQMVANEYIKPIVILGAAVYSSNSSYYPKTVTALYTGGSCTGFFSGFQMLFMTNTEITGMQFTASAVVTSNYDGYFGMYVPIDKFHITLQE